MEEIKESYHELQHIQGDPLLYFQMNQQAAWMPCQEDQFGKYQKKKKDRTLVLTTHNLNESRVLADRITITASGRLFACGKSEYIKSNFREGNQLTFTTQNQEIKYTKYDMDEEKFIKKAQK